MLATQNATDRNPRITRDLPPNCKPPSAQHETWTPWSIGYAKKKKKNSLPTSSWTHGTTRSKYGGVLTWGLGKWGFGVYVDREENENTSPSCSEQNVRYVHGMMYSRRAHRFWWTQPNISFNNRIENRQRRRPDWPELYSNEYPSVFQIAELSWPSPARPYLTVCYRPWTYQQLTCRHCRSFCPLFPGVFAVFSTRFTGVEYRACYHGNNNMATWILKNPNVEIIFPGCNF